MYLRVGKEGGREHGIEYQAGHGSISESKNKVWNMNDDSKSAARTKKSLKTNQKYTSELSEKTGSEDWRKKYLWMMALEVRRTWTLAASSYTQQQAK